MFTELGNHSQNQFWNVFVFLERNSFPVAITSHSPSKLQLWANTNLPLSIYLSILDTSCKWTHTLRVLSCLASLTEHVFKAHPCGTEYHILFLSVYHIPLYVYNHILFTDWLADGLLGFLLLPFGYCEQFYGNILLNVNVCG